MLLPPLSLYIHIPWCGHKCPYCDYHSHVLNDHDEVPHQIYVKHLLADLDGDLKFTHGRTINTLFIGGGTPSLLSVDAMQQLLDGIRKRLRLAPDIEISLEANPSSVETDKFLGYQQAGVNRISIGVQSFQPQKLNLIGRLHGHEEAWRAARLAANIELNSFNLDLMYGLPNQTIEEALNDLRQAITLAPPHLSWYQLTIEPHTIFGYRHRQRQLPAAIPNDDLLLEIYQLGLKLLTAGIYKQYEISAYALPGFQCRHNLNYWRFGDYLGIGCGAHGKLTQQNGLVLRTVKVRHPRRYMQGTYLEKCYSVPPADLPLEYFMNRFRLLEAVPRAEFIDYTGLTEIVVRPALDQALVSGYITENDSYWQVTENGQLLLNSLLELFI